MEIKYYLGFLAFMLVQTGGLIWFLSALNVKVGNLIEQVKIINQVYVTEKDMTEKHKRIHMRIDVTSKDIKDAKKDFDKEIDGIKENCKLTHQGKK